MYSPCSIEKTTEAVRGVMEALHEHLDVEASRYTLENVLAKRNADYAHRAAMAAVRKIKDAMGATDIVRDAVDSRCRDRAVMLSLSMQDAFNTAERLVLDTKQCMDEIEERFVNALKASEVKLDAACAGVDCMTREKARAFYNEARGTKRAMGEHIIETATRVALGCVIVMEADAKVVTKKRLVSECDDKTPAFLTNKRLLDGILLWKSGA